MGDFVSVPQTGEKKSAVLPPTIYSEFPQRFRYYTKADAMGQPGFAHTAAPMTAASAF